MPVFNRPLSVWKPRVLWTDQIFPQNNSHVSEQAEGKGCIYNTAFLMQRKHTTRASFSSTNILQRHERTPRRRQEAEDSLVCDEVLLIHSNDEWMDCDLFFNWNLLLTQPVSTHSYLNFPQGKNTTQLITFIPYNFTCKINMWVQITFCKSADKKNSSSSFGVIMFASQLKATNIRLNIIFTL